MCVCVCVCVYIYINMTDVTLLLVRGLSCRAVIGRKTATTYTAGFFIAAWYVICYVLITIKLYSYFILPTAYTVDASVRTSTLPSLSLIDMTYCTLDTKATPASVQGVGVDF